MNAARDLFSVQKLRVLVTGGTSGIGRMIAEGFVERGAQVVVSSRKRDAGDETVHALSRVGSCQYIAADLATEHGCEALAEQVTSGGQGLDVLVNCAGATWGAPLGEHDAQSWTRVMNLNVQGVFHMTKYLVPALRANSTPTRPSRIVNVGSIDGLRVPEAETYSYGASKAAVHHLTRHLAQRLAPDITVNALAPGPFPSRMMATTLARYGDEVLERTPLQRLGGPGDMAGAAIFLASEAGSYVTGVVLAVDGGLAGCR